MSQERPEWVTKVALVAAGGVITLFLNLIVSAIMDVSDRQHAADMRSVVKGSEITQLRNQLEQIQNELWSAERRDKEGGRNPAFIP